MQQRTLLYLGTIIILLGATSAAMADVPDSIGYQGMLTSGGSPVTTTVTVIFSIYDDEAAGTLLWSESQSVTPDANGLYSVYLGGGTLLPPDTPLSEEIFDGPNRWLEIKVESDPPMARVPFVTTPYTYRVSTVDGSTGGEIQGNLIVGMAHYLEGSYSNMFGFAHNIIGDASAISGGFSNVVNGNYGSVGGGTWNEARDHCFVGGGEENAARGMHSTVGGGQDNLAEGEGSNIGGGTGSSAYGRYSTVSGGQANIALSERSTVGGGYANEAGGIISTIAGGGHNITRGAYSVIGGGGGSADSDSNATHGEYSSILGGRQNIISAGGNYATIGGGYRNTVSSNSSTVAGGTENVASGNIATVAGGGVNIAAGNQSVCGGGFGHNITGHGGTISGGIYHHVGGQYSCIPGGERDTVNGDHSMAFGFGVYISDDRRVAFFDSLNPGTVRINCDDRDEVPVTSHPLRVGTDGSNGNGAYLSMGGTWYNGSSRMFKENFEALDGKGLLAKIAAMPVESWNYKDTDEKHIGPVAEDFVAEFDVGPLLPDGSRENKYLSPSDVAGVALAAIKELNNKNEKLEAENREIKNQVAELQDLVQQLLEERR